MKLIITAAIIDNPLAVAEAAAGNPDALAAAIETKLKQNTVAIFRGTIDSPILGSHKGEAFMFGQEELLPLP